MRELESVNLTFGASENAPNILTYNQAVILTKLAERYNAGLSGSCGGWISVDRLYKSQYVLLRNARLNIASPTFENCFDDSFKIDSIENKTIFEGQSIELSSANISNDVLTFTMNPAQDVRIISKDSTTPDSYIRGRISLTSNKIVVHEASQNDSWTAKVTVHATPTYSYYDNNGNRQVTQGATISSVLTVTATAVTSIKIEGPDMVNAGEEVTYTATPVPASSTKKYSSIQYTSLKDGFVGNSNTYRINTADASDTITATMYLYGESLSASKTITLGVELLNDTDKNPQMFGIIKEALGLGDDVHSFSVVDAMKVDNEGADAIFTLLTNNSFNVNTGTLYDFSAFAYFTNVTALFEGNTQESYYKDITVSKIVFPPSLKQLNVLSFKWIEGDFDASNIITWSARGRENDVLNCTGTANVNVSELRIYPNGTKGNIRCNHLIAAPKTCTTQYATIYVQDSIPNLGAIANAMTSNIRFVFPNANTIILPEGLRTLPVLENNPSLKYFRVGENGVDSVNLPASITSLPNQAFYGCVSLEMNDVTNIKSFGNNAFSGCVNLNVQELGDNITVMNGNVFNGCLHSFTNRVITIKFADTVNSIQGYSANIFDRGHIWRAVSKAATTISTWNAATSKNIWIDLREVPFVNEFNPAGWNSPFIDFTNQSFVTYPGGTWVNTIARVYVPDALVASYKAATNWTAAANRIYGETQFKADAVATGVGKLVDESGNEVTDPTKVTAACTWEVHPYDDTDKFKYGLPDWKLADDV